MSQRIRSSLLALLFSGVLIAWTAGPAAADHGTPSVNSGSSHMDSSDSSGHHGDDDECDEHVDHDGDHDGDHDAMSSSSDDDSMTTSSSDDDSMTSSSDDDDSAESADDDDDADEMDEKDDDQCPQIPTPPPADCAATNSCPSTPPPGGTPPAGGTTTGGTITGGGATGGATVLGAVLTRAPSTPSGELPATGADTLYLGFVGLILIAGGAALVRTSRSDAHR